VTSKYVNNEAINQETQEPNQTKPILTDREIEAIDLNIFAAENIDRFMHNVCALLAANNQTESTDRNRFY
jgi:hypothetical protein